MNVEYILMCDVTYEGLSTIKAGTVIEDVEIVRGLVEMNLGPVISPVTFPLSSDAKVLDPGTVDIEKAVKKYRALELAEVARQDATARYLSAETVKQVKSLWPDEDVEVSDRVDEDRVIRIIGGKCSVSFDSVERLSQIFDTKAIDMTTASYERMIRVTLTEEQWKALRTVAD